MRGRAGLVAVLVGVGLVPLLGAAVIVLPRLVYPPLSDRDLRGVASVERRHELRQAQARVQGEFRGQVLQGIGGLLLVAGVVGAWQQTRIARDGQITERFTRAIDQIGSDTLDVRLGGIYALERIAKNSPPDRPTVTAVLGGVRARPCAVAGGFPGRSTSSHPDG